MRNKTALAVSCVAHVLLGIALTALIWRAAPQEPTQVAVPIVFVAPGEPQATTAPQPAPAEPSQSNPLSEEPVAAASPNRAEETAPVPPAPEPMQEPATIPSPDRTEDTPPVLPEPEPVPEPPPPPSVEAPPLPPPPVPHPKPPAKQFAVRSPIARPPPPQPGPATAPPDMPAPSGPGTPSEAPTAPAAHSPAVAGWNTLFSAWLAARKTYPEAARRHGEQGSVTLRFRVAADGTVLEVELVTGSGSPALDAAAEALLRDAKLPPPPTEISRTVRLRYRLDD